MKTTLSKSAALIAALSLVGMSQADPAYTIIDIGLVGQNDSASQAFGISPGGVATGRSLHSGGAQAFSWTQGGGLVGLPNLSSPARPYAVGNSANDFGTIVGTGATTAFGSSRLPLMWHNGVVSQLALPGGQTLGDANGVNASDVAVGSCNSGIDQRGVIYQGGSASIISTVSSTGCYFLTAFGINDSGL
ncbi:MAG TPA: hypothetical protein VG820_07225, partial [Fimbriimonadaceae bacterium]|nr:hypothetical protein [Fimbriimonadaceae bacterium]